MPSFWFTLPHWRFSLFEVGKRRRKPRYCETLNHTKTTAFRLVFLETPITMYLARCFERMSLESRYRSHSSLFLFSCHNLSYLSLSLTNAFGMLSSRFRRCYSTHPNWEIMILCSLQLSYVTLEPSLNPCCSSLILGHTNIITSVGSSMWNNFQIAARYEIHTLPLWLVDIHA